MGIPDLEVLKMSIMPKLKWQNLCEKRDKMKTIIKKEMAIGEASTFPERLELALRMNGCIRLGDCAIHDTRRVIEAALDEAIKKSASCEIGYAETGETHFAITRDIWRDKIQSYVEFLNQVSTTQYENDGTEKDSLRRVTLKELLDPVFSGK